MGDVALWIDLAIERGQQIAASPWTRRAPDTEPRCTLGPARVDRGQRLKSQCIGRGKIVCGMCEQCSPADCLVIQSVGCLTQRACRTRGGKLAREEGHDLLIGHL